MKPKPFGTSDEAYHFARLLSERGYTPNVRIRKTKFIVISGAPAKVWHEVTKKFNHQRSLRSAVIKAKQEQLI